MVSSPPVYLPQSFTVTDGQFWELAKTNPELRLERTAAGELIIMPPTGGEGGSYNAEVTTDIAIWNRRTQLGKVFDSSTGFKLPNGATRAPDTAWITNERWNAIPSDQRKKFAPICPDFILELASESDDLDTLRQKMQEYIENGCRLGWLIIPKMQQVEIYRIDGSTEILQSPVTLSGENVLPGFTLSISTISQTD
ncbi:MAG: Uma2 family endonuclease [Thermosynechococcaceae cyanobacterium MS004]|nr:Uma2 family endonuclease [Thermosynechococcaceae cyanobacterium MS004]